MQDERSAQNVSKTIEFCYYSGLAFQEIVLLSVSIYIKIGIYAFIVSFLAVI